VIPGKIMLMFAEIFVNQPDRKIKIPDRSQKIPEKIEFIP